MSDYDYIVVGAGSAGCVVANRLTGDPNISVLLLEAGDADDLATIHAPRAWRELWKTSVDWDYVTEPEPGLGGRSINWPRGKGLGGTSSINAMVYIRGNRYDYDHWAELGNPGWSYEQVLPYFLKSEDQERGASPYHGTGGPLAVSDLAALHPYSLKFVEAAAELGYPRNPDFNGESQWGTGLYQRTIKGDERMSTARAFLHPVRQRANLHLLTRATATSIIFEQTRAIGIRYLRDGTPEEARAQREVIVSAGVIDSAKLLMLSGVGPADNLHAVGIPSRVNLPGVGKNLQDHPNAVVRCWTSTHYPLASGSNRIEAGLFCNSADDSSSRAPELQYHFAPISVEETHGGKIRSAFAVVANLARPRSRGSIELYSADPARPPIIHANYYAEDSDITLMVEAVKLGRQLTLTRAFRDIRVEEERPGDAINDNAAIEAYVRETGSTTWHPVGTCKMGIDSLAVVDPELRVYGAEHLRVIDASIMPTITSGNTNAPAIMIGEKGADLIKRAQSLPQN